MTRVYFVICSDFFFGLSTNRLAPIFIIPDVFTGLIRVRRSQLLVSRHKSTQCFLSVRIARNYLIFPPASGSDRSALVVSSIECTHLRLTEIPKNQLFFTWIEHCVLVLFFLFFQFHPQTSEMSFLAIFFFCPLPCGLDWEKTGISKHPEYFKLTIYGFACLSSLQFSFYFHAGVDVDVGT